MNTSTHALLSSALLLLMAALCSAHVVQQNTQHAKGMSLPSPDGVISPMTRMAMFKQRKISCVQENALHCALRPTAESSVSGTIKLSTSFRVGRQGYHVCRVHIQASVRGLQPNARQAFHIHAFGDVSSTDGSSTGPHFESQEVSDSMKHGMPGMSQRHWGDMGNLQADEQGVALYDRVDDLLTLGSVVGRGITVHEGEDLGVKFQPSGGAGARVATCVIGLANPDL